MSTLQPPSVAPPDTSDEDPRIGHLLADPVPDDESTTAVLLGFPVDEGVVRNGGRPGAAEAPDQLRECLYGMTPDARRGEGFRQSLRRTQDAGNLVGDASLAVRQAALGDALAPPLRHDTVPIVLGGGHETAYGHFLSYVEAGMDVTILNWDAHPDVRPPNDGKPHSGSSFRQALAHPSGHCQHYAVAGLQPHSTAAAHLQYIDDHDGDYQWADDLTPSAITEQYECLSGPTMVTFDLDAVDQAQAPGVSAPAVGGLDRDVWLHAAYRAGQCPQVTSVDVVELNPRVDVDDRTARLAALTVVEILRGLTDRSETK
ncbi:MAG: formimidoylglutamase [Salinibacter sp.]